MVEKIEVELRAKAAAAAKAPTAAARVCPRVTCRFPRVHRLGLLPFPSELPFVSSSGHRRRGPLLVPDRGSPAQESLELIAEAKFRPLHASYARP
jgi:hypothetical protein